VLAGGNSKKVSCTKKIHRKDARALTFENFEQGHTLALNTQTIWNRVMYLPEHSQGSGLLCVREGIDILDTCRVYNSFLQVLISVRVYVFQYYQYICMCVCECLSNMEYGIVQYGMYM
jgi:hypothetical protein